jgi:hypothetical protein
MLGEGIHPSKPDTDVERVNLTPCPLSAVAERGVMRRVIEQALEGSFLASSRAGGRCYEMGSATWVGT